MNEFLRLSSFWAISDIIFLLKTKEIAFPSSARINNLPINLPPQNKVLKTDAVLSSCPVKTKHS